MVHTFEEVRTRTPAKPYEATPEAIMPQPAWKALLRDADQGLRPPYSRKALSQWLQATQPHAWAIGAPPLHPTTTTPDRERSQAGGGQGAERDTQARGHGRAPSEGQEPIGTARRKRHNVGAGNHQRTRKGQERGPRRRERGHHGRRHDPHPRRAYQDGGTSAAPPPADAARLPGAHTRITRRRSTNRTPYGSHHRTPTSHQKPHRG